MSVTGGYPIYNPRIVTGVEPNKPKFPVVAVTVGISTTAEMPGTSSTAETKVRYSNGNN